MESFESGNALNHSSRSVRRNPEQPFAQTAFDQWQGDGQNDQFDFSIHQEVVQTVISTGIVIWVVQGAQLLATFLSVAPAYLQLDPLHVLSKSSEDELIDESEDAFKLFDKKD